MAFPTGWNRKAMRFVNSGNVFFTGTSGTVELLLTADNLPSEMFDADGSYPARSDGGDIRFSDDAAGTIQLAREIVNFNIDNDPANGYAEIWVKWTNGVQSIRDSGTTTSASANKLIQTGQNFLTTVDVDDVVFNTTDNTYALVTSVDSDTQLTLSADIMASGENFEIYRNVFWVWWNNPSATEPAVTDTYGRNATWDGDNYVAVWHMNENGTDIVDSTGNGHTAARNGTPNRVAGPVGGTYGQDLNGSNEWFEVTDHADFDADQNSSIVAWVYCHNYGGEWRGIITKARDASDVAEWVGIWQDSSNPGNFHGRAGNQSASGSDLTQNAWRQIMFRWTYNNGPFTGYFQGGSGSDLSGTTQTNEPKELGTRNPVIGRAKGVSEYFDGVIAEVRWLAPSYRGVWRNEVDYETVNDPADFIRGTGPESGAPTDGSRDHSVGAGVGRGVYRGT